MDATERSQHSTDHPARLVTQAAPRLVVSRQEAAAALGMSLRHFQRHVQPHLRCIHSGQLRLYPLAELERWTSSHTSQAVQK